MEESLHGLDGADKVPAIAKQSTSRRKSSRRAFVKLEPTLRTPGKVMGPRGNRAIARILEAARQAFMTRGYAGATIDDIANIGGFSRATFYTYFPSKRDALLALGELTAHRQAEVVAELGRIEQGWAVGDISEWVHSYFKLLDEHGGFAAAWTQAAHEDEEVLRFGAHGHLEVCRRIGVNFGKLSGQPPADPTALGLVVHSMFERTWSYQQLYRDIVDSEIVERSVVDALVSMLRCP